MNVTSDLRRQPCCRNIWPFTTTAEITLTSWTIQILTSPLILAKAKPGKMERSSKYNLFKISSFGQHFKTLKRVLNLDSIAVKYSANQSSNTFYSCYICTHRRKVSTTKTESKLSNPGVSLPDLQPSSSVLLPSKVPYLSSFSCYYCT